MENQSLVLVLKYVDNSGCMICCSYKALDPSHECKYQWRYSGPNWYLHCINLYSKSRCNILQRSEITAIYWWVTARHWSYIFLALTHWYNIYMTCIVDERITSMLVKWPRPIKFLSWSVNKKSFRYGSIQEAIKISIPVCIPKNLKLYPVYHILCIIYMGILYKWYIYNSKALTLQSTIGNTIGWHRI